MTEQNILQQKQFNVLLIGDDCLDEYQYGLVERLSPEAPVPVFNLLHKELKPGMAGNVLKNLEALGCHVNYLHSETSIKTRLIDIRSKQHIVRIDNDVECKAIKFDTEIPPVYDAIVISDYNKGTVSYELIEELRKEFTGPIFVDTKKTDLKRLDGCFIKINQLEYSKITSNTFYNKLIVTLGGDGAMHDGKIYDAPNVEVVDVCGAGDTFLSALTYQYLLTKDINDAIKFAIKASAITVQHTGVYAPQLGEIYAS